MANGRKFALDMSKITKLGKDKADLATRKIIFDIGARVVMLSPVGDPSTWQSLAPAGYSGGQFRGNWQYGESKLPQGVLPVIDKTGEATLQKILAKLSRNASGRVHFIANNLPYAMRLETGWSKQAPAGMVAITIREFRGIVERVAKAIKRGGG